METIKIMLEGIKAELCNSQSRIHEALQENDPRIVEKKLEIAEELCEVIRRQLETTKEFCKVTYA